VIDTRDTVPAVEHAISRMVWAELAGQPDEFDSVWNDLRTDDVDENNRRAGELVGSLIEHVAGLLALLCEEDALDVAAASVVATAPPTPDTFVS
jgi:hypothetical protein